MFIFYHSYNELPQMQWQKKKTPNILSHTPEGQKANTGLMGSRQGVSSAVFPLGALGKDLCPCVASFQGLAAFLGAWAPFLHHKSQQCCMALTVLP